ncbi:RNB domain-containing ribonuclease [Occallatibacter riparius]|uniref:RNB domain-containing ribonuclease n=1 Tax=Occallatibacter riparius TaxID=1002689 RepID=A0A9J7BX86_9BACT|nr:RNB domain-containing ribonuclease [Occallatibacter riparius]UWZ86490.1 RNB domain-containing ribonuclease [Occallatibacter riparius]
MQTTHSTQPVHFNLVAAAHAAMLEHGFQPDFPDGTDGELTAILAEKTPPSASPRFRSDFVDLRSLLWSSIDNDTSKDLDQIEWAERLPDGRMRVLVGVADVDSRVVRGSLIDTHARSETTSVYTGVKVFPMLPPELSEGITSLNEDEERAAIVIEYCVDDAGAVSGGKAYRALVRNRAQLAYNGVGAWLEDRGPAPAKVAANRELAAQLKLQDEAAQRLVGSRYQHGALDLETVETHPVMHADEAVDLARMEKNRATSLIEEFMVAANGVLARTFDGAKVASIRRIVRTPKRWDRIVELAEGLGHMLPKEPDSKALNDFLQTQKEKDPEHFPDLSLAVVKLMGPGEYVLVRPTDPDPGHFGLAVQDYTHSTAPNRRFPDMVAQRILKAVIGSTAQPYSEEELNAIAERCTLMENMARKVEREMQKRIAAVVLHPRIGQVFRAIVTGVNEYGTFVRSLDPHVEGKLIRGGKGLDVGDRLQARLIGTDPARGFIDFAAL